MKPRCNLTEEERKRILPEIKTWITEDEESELLRHFRQYLFYWYDRGTRQTYCSACGARNRGTAGKLRHGKEAECLACGNRVQAAAVNRYGYAMKALRSWGRAVFIRTDGEGNLLILSANVLRWFTQDTLRGSLEVETKAQYYFAPGKVQMWRSSNYWEDGYWKMIPHAAKTVGEGFPSGYAYGYVQTDGNYLTIGMENLDRSAFRYSGVWEYFAQQGLAPDEEMCRNVISYLAHYAMNPRLEMVTKLGLINVVDELLKDGRTNRKYLNWKAGTPAEFLRMPKADAKLFLKAGMDLKELKMYRDRWKDLPMEMFTEFRSDIRDEWTAEALLDTANRYGIGIRKAWKYATRFREHERRNAVREWIDYLSMAERLGLDLKEETVAMPKNLHERHDECAVLIKYQTTKEKEKAYRKRRKTLQEKYGFTLGDLSVIVPQDLGEIIREGQTLHHCVGGYAERHAAGKTCILFVRKARTPGRSFMTLELDEKRLEIAQIHGYKNERYKNAVPPSVRYRGFLDTWLGWVENGSRRDDRGKPILPKGVKTA